MTDKEKIIQWFSDIAEMCSRLTTGNVSHLGATIKGKAIRAAEYIEKHSIPEEPASEDLEEEIENYIKDSLAIKFPTTDKEQIKADIRCIAQHFAEWQKQKDMQGFLEKAVRFLDEETVLADCKIEQFKNYMQNEM